MSAVLEVLQAQRKRCLAGIMGAAETSQWWTKLTREQQLAFRQKVIDSLNVFYDLARDVVSVTDDPDVVRNDKVLELLLAKADRLQQTLDAIAFED